MRVLLVESCPGTSEDVRAQLTEAGHEIVECFDDTAPLCVGIDDARRCPLGHPVDVAVAVRVPGDGSAKLHEMGAVCAIRHRVPLVEYPGLETSPFHGHSVATSGDVVGAVEEVAGSGAPHAAAATSAVRAVPGLTGADPAATYATAERDGQRLHVVVHLPAGTPQSIAGMAATMATRAVREVDPYLAVIDVSLATR